MDKLNYFMQSRMLFQWYFLKACHQETEGCMYKTTCSPPGAGGNKLLAYTRLYVEHICGALTFSCLCKVLAVLLLCFPFCCWLCELAAACPGCNFVVCALGAKHWSQDYNLALRVPSRFSQHHKCNARFLFPSKFHDLGGTYILFLNLWII